MRTKLPIRACNNITFMRTNHGRHLQRILAFRYHYDSVPVFLTADHPRLGTARSLNLHLFMRHGTPPGGRAGELTREVTPAPLKHGA